MKTSTYANIFYVFFIWFAIPTMALADDAVVVAVPATGGAVEGKSENSDAFIWRLFTQFTAPAYKDKPSPVVFETWASDKDTFSSKPHWPEANEPFELRPSILPTAKNLAYRGSELNILTGGC